MNVDLLSLGLCQGAQYQIYYYDQCAMEYTADGEASQWSNGSHKVCGDVAVKEMAENAHRNPNIPSICHPFDGRDRFTPRYGDGLKMFRSSSLMRLPACTFSRGKYLLCSRVYWLSSASEAKMRTGSSGSGRCTKSTKFTCVLLNIYVRNMTEHAVVA